MATAKKAAAKRKSTAKKPATRKAAPKQPDKVSVPDYDPQWHAKVEAYTTLKNAGVEIPADLKTEVEKWIKTQQAQLEETQAAMEKVKADQAKKDDEGPKWVRNGFTGPFALRLDRQQGRDDRRRIELKPRGQRGDMCPLKPEDLQDQALLANLQTGLIEVITNGEAQRIVDKQMTNVKAVHTPLAVLRNENGQPMTGGVIVETEYNQQGVVVGYVDPNARKNAPLGGIARPGSEQVQQFVPTGGNPAIVSSGFQPVEASDKIADDLARRKDVEGRPEDVLGLTVSVAPTERG